MHRPRLFQSFSSRSKVQQTPDQQYTDHQYSYNDQYGSHPRRDAQTSTWRKVLSRKQREDNSRYEYEQPWEEEVVNWPSRSASYAGPVGTEYPESTGRRPPRDAYPASSGVYSQSYMGDHYASDNDTSTVGDPVPIVQRENSLSRMREMFTDRDRGRASHVTELPLPTNPSRFTVSDMQSPVEVHNAYPSRHQPVIINNTTTGHSVRPDMEHAPPVPIVMSDRARGKRPEYSSRSMRDSSPDVRF
ncbi:hypothetical protein BXZ70DRAFT_422123 [Cristinia sonorae]|uniref:Uncharacterized protein n=1 Tax=Cristinia sonorae TaxID=1940300 RepID=A0A8K0UW82_9AGAR|nr:hypothetical protein BXZ70DRAFT_422123 [Cristinia sonorae]